MFLFQEIQSNKKIFLPSKNRNQQMCSWLVVEEQMNLFASTHKFLLSHFKLSKFRFLDLSLLLFCYWQIQALDWNIRRRNCFFGSKRYFIIMRLKYKLNAWFTRLFAVACITENDPFLKWTKLSIILLKICFVSIKTGGYGFSFHFCGYVTCFVLQYWYRVSCGAFFNHSSFSNK